MSTAQSPSTSALFGSWEYIGVSRALAELHALRPVRINALGEALFVLPVEGLDDRRLSEFVSLCRPEIPRLIITKQRALAIGLNDAATPLVLQLPEEFNSNDVLDLVAARKSRFMAKTTVASSAAAAAMQLIKLSRGLPAVLAANMTRHGAESDHSMIAAHADAIDRFAAMPSARLPSPAMPSFRSPLALLRALSYFATQQVQIRWPSLLANLILRNQSLSGFIRLA